MYLKYRGRLVTAKDKRYLSLYREYGRLHSLRSKAPLVPVPEPYQHGWVRAFRLCDSIARTQAGPALLDLLNTINTRQYCRKGTFTQRNPHTRIDEPLPHLLKTYTEQEWNHLPWEQAYRKYFELRLTPLRNWKNDWVWNYRYCVRCPEWFVSVIEKNIVTHRKASMPEIESRLAELENTFASHGIQNRINTLLGIRRWRHKAERPSRQHGNFYAICAELDTLPQATEPERLHPYAESDSFATWRNASPAFATHHTPPQATLHQPSAKAITFRHG